MNRPRTWPFLAVAIAFHAAAHLDHLELVPASDVVLHGAHLALLAVVAFAAVAYGAGPPNVARSSSPAANVT